MRHFGSILLAAAMACVLALALGSRDNEVSRAEFESERAARQALEREVQLLRERLVEPPPAAASAAIAAGFVPYTRELPEPISAASTPALEALEEALRRGLVAVTDLPLLERLEREAAEHARRLVDDRLFRLGEQARAHVLSSGDGLRDLDVETLWSPPFLLVATEGQAKRPRTQVEGLAYAQWPSLAEIADRPPRYDRLLSGTAEVLQTVYRDVLARFGAPLGLRPLEDPFGGRPDLKLGVRSFEDGFPICVLLWAKPDAPRLSESGVPGDRHASGWLRDAAARAGRFVLVIRDDGKLELWAADPHFSRDSVPASRAALGAGTVLLHAFQRQRNAWRLPRLSYDAARCGLADLLGAWDRDESGGLVRSTIPGLRRQDLAELRSLRAMAASAQREPVWIPLPRLLRMESAFETLEWAAKRGWAHGTGDGLYRAQAWAFVQFLAQRPDGAAMLEALLDARLQGPLDAEAWRRLLSLRDEDDWDALEAAFRVWFDEVLMPSLPTFAPR